VYIDLKIAKDPLTAEDLKKMAKDPVEINYYDSYGDPPVDGIKMFIVRLVEKFLLKGEKVKILYNDKRHQYGNSECGVYSMNFILMLIPKIPRNSNFQLR
jgi:hypothetical protein